MKFNGMTDMYFNPQIMTGQFNYDMQKNIVLFEISKYYNVKLNLHKLYVLQQIRTNWLAVNLLFLPYYLLLGLHHAGLQT